MVWKAEELHSRLRVASVVGKRTEKEATELVSKVKERSDGTIPLFVSDNLDSYPNALLNVYGEKEEPKREKRCGRPRTKPVVRPPEELQYAQVVKHRDEHGRITSIERRVVFGTEEKVGERLGVLHDHLDSPCGERQPDVEADQPEAREGRPIVQRGDGGAAVPDRAGRRGPQLPEASRFAEDEAQEAAADKGEERDTQEMDAENPGHGGRDYWPQVDHGRADDLSNHQVLPLRDSI